MGIKLTKKQKIINHLREFGRISSLEASDLYRVTRVGAVVPEIRKLGFKIDPIWAGEGQEKYVNYTLIGEK